MLKRRVSLSVNYIEEPLVNLTPLIDVVFVVLIMFIVVAPLLEVDRIELANGNHSKTLQNSDLMKDGSDLTIHVREDNTIWYQKRKVNVDELIDQLKLRKNSQLVQTPKLIQDKNAFFGTYQEVKNAAEKAGFDQIDVILKPI